VTGDTRADKSLCSYALYACADVMGAKRRRSPVDPTRGAHRAARARTVGNHRGRAKVWLMAVAGDSIVTGPAPTPIAIPAGRD